jgi:serine/threonine-protein kinase
VDAAGTVYVAVLATHQVLKLSAGASSPSELPLTGVKQPAGLAADGAGNVYVLDAMNFRVLKLPVR